LARGNRSAAFALGAALLASSAAPSATARPLPYMTRAISDGGAFVTAADPHLADVALRRGARAGAQVVRLPLLWNRIEPGPFPPRDGTDPNDPAYDFTAFDGLLRNAVRAGLTPLARVDVAPSAYEAPGRWRFAATGVWAPDPGAYGRFAAAAARRYSGRFPDPLHPGAFLPRVRLWQVWNEPNLPQFLQPQWVVADNAWIAWSPAHYRRMLNAVYAAVKRVNRSNVIATAGTAPNGDPRDGEGRMTPVRFWQELLCLGSSPVPAAAPCPDPAHFDVLAHHPLTVTDPDVAASDAGNVSIADLYKIKRLLALAQRSGRVVPRRGTRLWVTELNWDSVSRGATEAQIQRWVPRALFRLWREGVDLVTWQFVRDPPAKPAHPAGLYEIDPNAPLDPSRDRPKPAVIRAFRFPFTGVRRDRRHVELWALLPRPASARVAIQRRRGGRWTTLRHVTANRHGVVHAIISLRGGANLRLAESSSGHSGLWKAPRR
jgi:hypothetical protein